VRDLSRTDGLEAVDHFVLAVGDGDVALPEQFDDDPGRAVVAFEDELEDAVELVLLDAGEVGAGEAVAEHHRELGRAAGGVGNALGGDRVGSLGFANLDDQFRTAAVEVPHLEPDEVVAVEIGLVQLRTLVGP